MSHPHLVALLAERAEQQGDDVAYVFLGDGETESARLTYGELAARAWGLASRIRERHARGERALLLYPAGLEFVVGFFGALAAGVVAVPCHPPRARESLARLRALAQDAEASLVLGTGDIVQVLRARGDEAPELAALDWMTTDHPADVSARSVELATPLRGEDLAFLQYTSGSTGDPKGVMVSHANVMANQRMIAESFGHDRHTVVVGWLPLFHDMGLIGNLLQPFYLGARCIFMPPLAFLQRPVRWLRAIATHAATTSGGPNFAYDLCVTRIGEEQRAGLHLGSWQVAFSGAEPVRAETLARFTAAFEPCGFRAGSFYPCYGLAEATLLVTGGERGRVPRVVRGTVSCGHTWGGQELHVVDPATAAPCAEGETGEILVRGSAVAAGYWGKPELSRDTFSPMLHTGDLGFLDGSDLFVTGRLKDVLIVRGRKHHPEDVEHAAAASHPALRPGGAVAFLVERGAHSALVVVQEVRRERTRTLDPVQVAGDVRAAISAEHGLMVELVLFVKEGTLLRTTSGKVRRGACREAFLRGELADTALATSGSLPEPGGAC